MDGQEWVVRLRSVFDDYFTILVGALLVVALVGGYLTYTAYGQTHTEIRTEQTSSWESSASFGHSATVVRDTAVYTRGETLRDRGSYVRAVTPRLNGSFRYAYTATDSGNLSADASVSLVLRSATETDDGNTTEYWRLETPLGTQEAVSLSPGESVRIPFSTNVTAAALRLESVDEQLGGTPGEKELLVRTRLALSGTRNGQPVEDTSTYRLPVSFSGNVYQVQDPGPVTDSGSQTERRVVTVEPGLLRAYGGPILVVSALLGLGGLLLGRRGGYLSASGSERDWLAFRSDREEFDDWITVVDLPGIDRSRETVTVTSLEGLVDIAIDTEGRVLEDRDRERFFLFEEDRTYVYDPPSLPDAGPSLRDGVLGSSADMTDGSVPDADGSAPDVDGDAAPDTEESDGGAAGDGNGNVASGER
jgi:hypothetical protein